MSPRGPSILHVDMDAFYAAVEVLEDPSLAGRAVIVGGTGARGVVASCTYEARIDGVRSAMPTAAARRRCPHAVFLPGRHDLYQSYSRRIHEVFDSFTPLVEGIALDEAFLDVGGAARLFGPAPELARSLRRRIEEETGLTCSVGVARNKLLAKLASEAAKPKVSGRSVLPGPGVVVVDPAQELAFLHPLPAEALWGVGPATLSRLARFGVRTVGDLAALPEATLVGALGPAVGGHLHDLAWARDDRPVEVDRPAKSIGHEETWAEDRHDREGLRAEAVRLADAVGSRLRDHGLKGRTVTVKVRFADFRTITRARTLPEGVDGGHRIAAVAAGLLAEVDPGPGVRLLGVSVGHLGPAAPRQPSLPGSGPDAEERWASTDGALDAIRRRFGRDAVGPGVLLGGGSSAKRPGDQQWGPSDRRPR
ncbi:MAG: DNA polymerase IV [Acidimicrobiales bacterium]